MVNGNKVFHQTSKTLDHKTAKRTLHLLATINTESGYANLCTSIDDRFECFTFGNSDADYFMRQVARFIEFLGFDSNDAAEVQEWLDKELYRVV